MLLGLDAFGSVVITCVLLALVPQSLPVAFTKEVYGLSASVLSIVFSVFTTSLAIIISSPDDKFVQFLQSENILEDILFGFKFTLVALFAALVYSIAAFGWTQFQIGNNATHQARWGLLVGVALLTYALGATLSSTLAAIRHARARAEFLRDAA